MSSVKRAWLVLKLGTVLFILMAALTACEDGVLTAIEDQVRDAGLADLTLTVLESNVGDVSPTGTIRIKDGDTVELTAVPPIDFDFVRWEQVNGSGSTRFANASATETVVTLNGGNATVRAIWDDTVDPTGSISIEDKINISGTDYRNDRTVDVSLSYDDNSGSVPAMKLSSSSFATGTTKGWQPAGLSTTFTFNSDGAKTLYVRFRDESGNESDLYSSDVYIDTTPPSPGIFEVRHLSNTEEDRDYVTGVSSDDIAIIYRASDAASGVENVYFSNAPYSRPSTPQVQDYVEPTSPAYHSYQWELTPYLYFYGDYTVNVWFEDKLGNISSTPHQDTVRYDDPYEKRYGNGTFDAVSGATLIIEGSAEDALLSSFTGDGTARLKDADVFKFGFSNPYYDATIKLDLNTIDPDPRVRFYDNNRNFISGVVKSEPTDSFEVQYDFTLPDVTYDRYYYIYMLVDRSSTTPYEDDLGYNIDWFFDYWGY